MKPAMYGCCSKVSCMKLVQMHAQRKTGCVQTLIEKSRLIGWILTNKELCDNHLLSAFPLALSHAVYMATFVKCAYNSSRLFKT